MNSIKQTKNLQMLCILIFVLECPYLQLRISTNGFRFSLFYFNRGHFIFGLFLNRFDIQFSVKNCFLYNIAKEKYNDILYDDYLQHKKILNII